jgi:hypothetical protein
MEAIVTKKPFHIPIMNPELTPSLRVTDANNQVATDTLEVPVNEPPSPTPTCEGQSPPSLVLLAMTIT